MMHDAPAERSKGWYPFWFWNDTLSEAEIRWQIAQMAEQGLRGFVPSPRQGLTTPYLSEAFFKMMGVAVAAAAEHGMVVHLYDELPYPSGAAGGEVLLGNPHFYATELTAKTIDIESQGPFRLELPRGKILCCVAYPIKGDAVDWSGGRDLKSSVGVVLTEHSYQEVGLTSYNRKRYFSNVAVPTLEAALPPGRYRIFVSAQTTLENHKYYFHFIDALNPQAVTEFLRLTHDRYFQHFGPEFGKTIRSIFTDETQPVWSERLPGEFFARTGYDLLPLLPALADAAHPRHAEVKSDFHRVKYELFVDAFEKPCARWCREHGIAYWGEKPLLRLSQLQFSDVPGCDSGHVKAGAPLDLVSGELRMNPRAAASAAYFYGKSAALCECYHSLGWGATLQDLKRLADGLLLHGISCFVPHAFFYSTHGLKKHDAPPSMFFQMPYWKFFGQMVRRTQRVLDEFEGTHIVARVLIVDPTPGVPSADQLREFVRVQQQLLESHVDYLLVDVDTLQTGRFEQGRLLVNDLRVELIVVPPMVRMEPALQKWLAEFESAGGKVARSEAEMIAKLPAPSLEIGDAKQVQMVTRQGGGRTLWLLLNAGNTAVELSFEAGPLMEIVLDAAVQLSLINGKFHRRLEPSESVLLSDAPMTHEPETRSAITLPASMEMIPQNANLLPLREWRLEFDGQSATVQPAPIVHQLELGKFKFAPVVHRAFGSIARFGLPMMELQYTTQFENQFTGPVTLVLEPGSIRGDCIIAINGDQSLLPAPVDVHIRGSLGAEITHLLHSGTNTIIIRIRTDRVDGGLLNCLYVAGDFGVGLNPLRLTARPQLGSFGQWENSELPFFAGVVEYRGSIALNSVAPLIEIPIDPVLLGDDACEVCFNDGAWHAMLWNPRLIRPNPGELHPGENPFRLRVYTTLLRAFEGQRFDPLSHGGVGITGL